MCGRFALINSNKLSQRFKTQNRVNFPPSYNISPGLFVPVITRNSPNKAVYMRWGLVPFWAKDPSIGYKMINARAEDIQNKPAFRKPIRTTRCLVPADGFYEWKRLNLEGKEENIPWYIKLKREDTFALAGIYDRWINKEEKEILSFSIITTKANKLIALIHDRMPVILNKQDEGRWLNTKTKFEDTLQLLTSYPSEKMLSYPASLAVNNPNNNSGELTQPTQTQPF